MSESEDSKSEKSLKSMWQTHTQYVGHRHSMPLRCASTLLSFQEDSWLCKWMHHSTDSKTGECSTVLIVSHQAHQARLAQSAERKALNLVVVGSSLTVGATIRTGEHSVRLRETLGGCTRLTWGRNGVPQKMSIHCIQIIN